MAGLRSVITGNQTVRKEKCRTLSRYTVEPVNLAGGATASLRGLSLEEEVRFFARLARFDPVGNQQKEGIDGRYGY